MLILIDTLADAILLPINPILFRLGEMTVVRRHVFFLAVLHVGFAVLQITGLFRAQGAVLDATGDAILLVRFTAVYLIHAGTARIDDARSGPEVEIVAWAIAEPVNISPPTARIKSDFEIWLIISVETLTEKSSSLLSHSASYEGDVRLVTAEVDVLPLVLSRPVLRKLPLPTGFLIRLSVNFHNTLTPSCQVCRFNR